MKAKLIFLLLFCSFSLLAKPLEQELQKAISHYQAGQYQEAQILLQKLDKQDNNNFIFQVKVKNNLGNVFAVQGKNTAALNYYLAGLKLSRKSHLKREEAELLKNIGILYVSWKKWDQAKSYYQEASLIAKKLKLKDLLADCHNNLGIIAEQQNKLEEAENCYQKALSIYSELKRPDQLAMTYSNLAIVAKAKGQMQKAINYTRSSLEFAIQSNDAWMTAAIENNLGNTLREAGMLKEAELHLMNSYTHAKELNALEIMIMVMESRADLAAAKQDYKQAFKYQQEMNRLNAQFLSETQSQQFHEMEVKFRTQEKTAENERLKLEKKQIEQRNFWILLSGIGFALFITTAFWFLFRLRKQKSIQEFQLQLNKTMLESENRERFRIARDLHDSVGQMLSVIKMHSQQNEQVSELVDQTITEVRNISHHLIPEALNFGLKHSLEELCSKISKSNQVECVLSWTEQKEQLELDASQSLNIYRILQEITGNSIKHSGATRMEINILCTEKIIELFFSDNGKGVSEQQLEKSQGLGWKNLQARLQILKGTIEIKQEDGTQMRLMIPYE